VKQPDPYKNRTYVRNRRLVLEAARFRCAICGGRAQTADHIRPLVMGGSHDIANLRALCTQCNSRLGAELLNRIRAQRRLESRLGHTSRRW
jgi:5-methylcytosine-specific restriction endonuclease McrA